MTGDGWKAYKIDDTYGLYHYSNGDPMEPWWVDGPTEAGNGGLPAFTKEDAHLIAAAPDLLTACEQSFKLFDLRLTLADICDDEKVHLDVLRAAIAKAKAGRRPE